MHCSPLSSTAGLFPRQSMPMHNSASLPPRQCRQLCAESLKPSAAMPWSGCPVPACARAASRLSVSADASPASCLEVPHFCCRGQAQPRCGFPCEKAQQGSVFFFGIGNTCTRLQVQVQRVAHGGGYRRRRRQPAELRCGAEEMRMRACRCGYSVLRVVAAIGAVGTSQLIRPASGRR